MGLQLTPDDRDFQSEAAGRFINHGGRPPKSFKPTDSLMRSVPFEGSTTHKDAFIHHRGARPAQAKPRDLLVFGNPENRQVCAVTDWRICMYLMTCPSVLH